MKATKIAQESRRCLALEVFLEKIAQSSMGTWVCGILGQNFASKKALRSSLMVLGFWSHGPTGLKLGAVDICFPV